MKKLLIIATTLAATCILSDSVNSGIFNFGIALFLAVVMFCAAMRLAED